MWNRVQSSPNSIIKPQSHNQAGDTSYENVYFFFERGLGNLGNFSPNFNQILGLKTTKSLSFNKHVQDQELVICSVAISMHLGTFIVRILCGN